MRRLIVLAGLVGSIVLVANTGWGDASVPGAHATSTVRIIVHKAPGGATVAIAAVTVHGRVFPFVIDTGAEKTLVDTALARELHLKTVGKPINVSGVGCSETARNVHLRNWSLGGQSLPNIVATSSNIAGANGHALGLLGSDVLSRFGAVGIDYAHGQLTLG
ncbi:MAG: retropepsin-like domain-containing protein [Solirubrobacterales bacterium]|nr:retropepsin-like domain-containing protein [Solirubrobacterales bacterium]